MTVDTVMLGVGVALLTGGVVWRVLAVRRRRAHFLGRARAALGAQDRTTRCAAVAVVTQQGLSPVAELLLEATQRETEATVLDAIAEAVGRHQWEPSHRRELFELRLWAQCRLQVRPLGERPARPRPAPTPERRLVWPPSHPAHNGHVTEAAARLCDLLEPGDAGTAAASPAPTRSALAVMAAGGWRRLSRSEHRR
ncbi:MAG TPA: hypothetical protein VG294_15610 [Solirubrobacteraceae bacterium]|jgi:hypothetical protein|nr:hypothetical protein [Solirubrobacteraceae bacterium]